MKKTRTELYEKFGLAAEAGQLLETELINCVLALEGLERGWYENSDQENATLFLRKLDKDTLGALIRRLKNQLDIEEEEISFLGNSLDARNKLNHGFFLRHDFAIQSAEGRGKMFEDLEEIHQELFEAWQNASYLSGILGTALQVLLSVREEKPPENH